jgi:hypothetical protein
MICKPVSRPVATKQPRGQRKDGKESLLLAEARHQQQLCTDDDPKDSLVYLNSLLDSMNDHRAWEASLSIGIERSMHDTGRFIDLTGSEGSSNNARPSQGGAEGRG